MSIERRMMTAASTGVEVRQAEEDASSLRISGYAAVFNASATIAGLFREQIKPGAFRRAIEERQDVALLLNHNPETVMARVSNGSLVLREDDRGLYFEATLHTDDTDATRTVAKIRHGNISQMSFAFNANVEEWDYDAVPPLRSILDTDLFDVSPVTYPAYEQTAVQARERE